MTSIVSGNLDTLGDNIDTLGKTYDTEKMILISGVTVKLSEANPSRLH